MNTDEARDEAFRAFRALCLANGYSVSAGDSASYEYAQGWNARGQHDEQRIAELEAALRRYMLYVDSYGYESTGPLAQAFGPVEHPGSSISTEAWLDRVLREPALRALGQSEEVKP